MKTEVRQYLPLLVWLVALVAVTQAAPPNPTGTLVAPETRGPNSTYVYKNNDGVFELNSDGHGTAMYRWRDQRAMDARGIGYLTYTDSLSFLREATFYTDEEPHKGWIYEARGGGNTWYLFFGSTPMGKDEVGDDLYPLYFSFDEPTKNRFDRWRTNSGTSRLRLQ